MENELWTMQFLFFCFIFFFFLKFRHKKKRKKQQENYKNKFNWYFNETETFDWKKNVSDMKRNFSANDIFSFLSNHCEQATQLRHYILRRCDERCKMREKKNANAYVLHQVMYDYFFMYRQESIFFAHPPPPPLFPRFK